LIVGQGRNWKIPVFMPVLLRYISGPVLAIILSFAVPEFHSLRYDPLMVLGFIASILSMVAMIAGFFFPRCVGYCSFIKTNLLMMYRFLDSLVPAHRRSEGTEETVVNELKQKDSIDSGNVVEVVSRCVMCHEE
jgi:solute carrier family 6 GABA transporter-like protein 1